MRRDEGAVEFGSVMVLFFIVSLIAGGVLFASTGMVYTQTYSAGYERKKAADLFLRTVVDEMQPLKDYEYDSADNVLLNNLRVKYAEYGLEFSDVSSGYHLDFLSDEDLADHNLCEFLFLDGAGSNFITWRGNNGLSTSKTPWREMIKEAAWDSCVSYGWLHTSNAESFAYKAVVKTFSSANKDGLFPMVNDFPLININMVKPEILRPLIMRPSFKIKNPKEKADALINKLGAGPVLYADISSMMETPVTNPLMNYLGTKTAFWKIYFVMDGTLKVEAVAAAIPVRNGKIQEIEKYQLLDRSFIDD
jgi:hypothetical protein